MLSLGQVITEILRGTSYMAGRAPSRIIASEPQVKAWQKETIVWWSRHEQQSQIIEFRLAGVLITVGADGCDPELCWTIPATSEKT